LAFGEHCFAKQYAWQHPIFAGVCAFFQMWDSGRGLAFFIECLTEAEAKEYVVWLGCHFWQKDFGFFH
jgi:hypothetical protein